MTDTTRRFSFSHPTRYQGQTYPTAEADIDYGNGTTQQGRIFADANGVYHTLDAEGNILDATPVHGLDEVIVTAPRRDNLLSERFNRFLTESNDNAMVNNTAHRQYNTHLEENALQGAKAHALWDKEHPNLSAWRDAVTAVPLAVAAAPFAVGAGKAAIGTAAGQTARNGLVALMTNPIMDAANTALGLGFAGKGAYDVSQGEFTPETAMDLAGGLELLAKGSSMFDRFLTARNSMKDLKASTTDNTLFNFNEEFPLVGKRKIPEDIKREAAKNYTAFINSDDYYNRLQRANLEDHWDYMKQLTDRRVNGRGNFPGKVSPLIGGDYKVQGQAGIFPFSSSYGVTLKEDLAKGDIMDKLMHELSHWATGAAGTVDKENKLLPPFIFRRNTDYIGDIMRHNENIAPNKPLAKVIQNVLPVSKEKMRKIVNRYYYLVNPQEKRARAVSLYQYAKDNNMSTDELVDLYTKNGEIAKYAPEYLRDMGKILTPENLKKYLKDFLSVAAPVGIAPSLNLNNE